MRRRIIDYFLLFISVCISNAFAQEGAVQSRETLQLVSADSLEMRSQGSEEILVLHGDVKMVQGEAFLNCQNATWWREKQRMLLLDDVHIYDGKRDLRADRVEYDGKTKTEKAQGHVQLEIGNRTLKANQVTYAQDSEEIFARGNIRFIDLVEKTTLFGDESYYDRTDDYGWVKGNSYVVKMDTASGDSMIVKGLKIEAWGKDQAFTVTDSVVLQKGSLKAKCRYAYFQSQNEELRLEQMPMMWYQNHEMQGDTITLQMKDLHFQGGKIHQHAQIFSRDSTTVNELKGQIITFEASDDTIRAIYVYGQAVSIYHISDEDSKDEGMNTVTGDRIVIQFKGDEINRVLVESDPGQSTGTYKPKEKPVQPGTTPKETL